jgi:hypothetical protein
VPATSAVTQPPQVHTEVTSDSRLRAMRRANKGGDIGEAASHTQNQSDPVVETSDQPCDEVLEPPPPERRVKKGKAKKKTNRRPSTPIGERPIDNIFSELPVDNSVEEDEPPPQRIITKNQRPQAQWDDRYQQIGPLELAHGHTAQDGATTSKPLTREERVRRNVFLRNRQELLQVQLAVMRSLGMQQETEPDTGVLDMELEEAMEVALQHDPECEPDCNADPYLNRQPVLDPVATVLLLEDEDFETFANLLHDDIYQEMVDEYDIIR